MREGHCFPSRPQPGQRIWVKSFSKLAKGKTGIGLPGLRLTSCLGERPVTSPDSPMPRMYLTENKGFPLPEWRCGIEASDEVAGLSPSAETGYEADEKMPQRHVRQSQQAVNIIFSCG